MFRRFVLIMNAIVFSWVQSAFALKPDAMNLASKFVKESGISQKEVPLREMYEKFGKDLPEPIRLQMEYYSKENPSLLFPKMDVKKVKTKGEDQLQFNINTPKGSLVVTTQNSKEVFVTVVGMYDKKKIQTEIKYQHLLAGHYMMYEARKFMKKNKMNLLSSEQVSKLSIEERKTYIKHLREISVAAEKVQTAFTPNAKNTSVYEKIFQEALVGEAWASDDNCMFAGWPNGVWRGKICTAPTESKSGCSSGEFRCNPDLYGELCISKSTSPSQLTATCSVQDSDFKHFAQDNTGKNRFENIDKLNETLGKMTDACNTSKSNIPDQQKACSEYESRVKDLKRACENDKLKTYYESICKAAQNPQPEPKPAGPVNPRANSNESANEPSCDELIKNQSKLETTNCQVEEKKHCDKGGGIAADIAFCSKCNGDALPIKTGSVILHCDARSNTASSKSVFGEQQAKEKSRTSSVGSWFSDNSSWLIPVGIGGLFLWLGYESQKSMINANYAPYTNSTPVQPAVPIQTNPSTTGGTGTGSLATPGAGAQ